MTGTVEEKRAFFISPIGEEGSEVRLRSDIVKRLILEAALCPGVVDKIDRADGHANPGEITPVIIAAILEAELVIVDLTGANPNVIYEMAIAHAHRKPTVHIRLEGEPLPFDLKDVRVFDYALDLEAGDRARVQVRDAAVYVLEHPEMVRTPVSGGVSLLSAQQSADPAAQLAGTVLRRIDELAGTVRDIAESLDHQRGGGGGLRALRMEGTAEASVESEMASLRNEIIQVSAQLDEVPPKQMPPLRRRLQRLSSELAALAEAREATLDLMNARRLLAGIESDGHG